MRTPIINIDAKHRTMGHRTIRVLLLAVLMAMTNLVQAQSYSNDFENGYTWYPPWFNLNIVADSTGNHVCLCDSIHEYGLGFSIEAGKNYPRQNIRCQYEFRFKALLTGLPTGGNAPLFLPAASKAQIVFSIDDDHGNRYWTAYPLQNYMNDTAEWSQVSLDLNFPSDYIGEGKIKSYIWNQGKERLVFDKARLEVTASPQPSYQPNIEALRDKVFQLISTRITPIIEYIDAQGDTIIDPSMAHYDYQLYEDESNHITINIKSTFLEDIRLLRLAFMQPLREGKLTVYRRNQHIDTTDFQSSYYLDREGFVVDGDGFAMCTYHNTGISSLQLDIEHGFVCFNIDYWRDHPLLRFPMRSDTSDYFEDISYRNVKAGEVFESEFKIYHNAPDELPRLMPVWDGYQSAFIFTEHADWTDLRTHRAVLFGNENITKPEDAIGGFCYYNIPVTKSVFYWNPDHTTNAETSKGLFTGEVATIKTDKEFYKLLKTIKKEGFEICLHSPEVYTTIPSKFPKAMRFMRRHFGTVSWIDHGYNNGPEKNREDMVCDGLLPESPQYAAELWKKNGVRYLWNAYYEENRMEQFNFDSHFVQPYDGFGDALPNRQITTLPNGDKDFRLWSTPSTLEVNDDKDWYYYFDSARLQKLADHHNVFITHVYPAWSDPYRGFWQYDDGSTAVAMPGFNFALSQLARFRDEKKILPTTVEQYLDYYEKLLNIEYQICDNRNIRAICLTNHGEAIEGLTLLCTRPIVVEGKPIDFRKVDEGYLVWFNIDKNETVTIRYRE